MMSRKQRKYEKEIRARRAAEQKVALDDAKKAQRDKQRAEQKKKNQEWAENNPTAATVLGVIALVVIIGFLISMCSSGDDTKSASGGSTSTSVHSPRASAPNTSESAPIVTGQTITMAENRFGIDIDATDVAYHLIDGEGRERGIFDPANWQIVAYCDRVVDGRLTVGVVKREEFAAISQARAGSPIANNTLKAVLDCP